MAVASTSDFSVTASDLIKDALIEIYAIAPDETPTADQQSHALRTLNYLIKTYQTQGYNLWRRERDTLTLVAGRGIDSNPYTFGGAGAPDKTYRPLRIENMRFVNADCLERPMMMISRDEYDNLPEKDVAETPTLFHYDPSRDQGRLFVWPLLQTGLTGSLAYTYQRPFWDFDVASNNPDVPQEWYETLKYALAARLAPTYFPQDIAMQQRLMQTASGFLENAMSFDKETASSFFTVNRRPYRRG
jgi:hypothetical protein